MDSLAWRQIRLPLFDHQTFALLTSHGLLPADINGGIETACTREAR